MAGTRTGRWKRWVRVAGIGLGVVVVILILILVCIRTRLWAGRPQIAGEVRVEGLDGEVRIDRDALGVPTITAGNRTDLAMALGFLHGQERFFQMDLMRRSAAGELSEVVGDAVLEMDMEMRLHRFRHRAGVVVEHATDEERRILDAYATGVNAGLEALGSRPFEYDLLRVRPVPWTSEDTVLVLFAMFVDLNLDYQLYEETLGVMHATLPRELFDFLAPVGTDLDAPLVGIPPDPATIPGPDVVDLREGVPVEVTVAEILDATLRPDRNGSNNWAVSGSRTADGRAIVANDMHLGISVPNTWYRARMRWPALGGSDELRDVTGVTLPGAPAMVAGSNGHVAWGLTNSFGDYVDLVVVEVDPGDPDRYMTPDGWREFEVITEEIAVAGSEPRRMTIRETVWGPVLRDDWFGAPLVAKWTAHDPDGANLHIMKLERAETLEQALAWAPECGTPAQNFTVADDRGRVAWTIMGRIPARHGWNGRTPVSWADGSHGWDGWVDAEDHPRVTEPLWGVIWTANSRIVDWEMLEVVGDGGYSLGQRQRQIRDALLRPGTLDEADMLDIALDDRALLVSRWRDVLLEVLDDRAVAGKPLRAELRRLVEESWTGRASVDSVGYHIVRQWRAIVIASIYSWLTRPCREADPGFSPAIIDQAEGPVWAILEERPAHLLDPSHGSWDEALVAMVDLTLTVLLQEGDPLDTLTWGRRNEARIQHPLSLAVPALSGWLDMPRDPLPGDSHMPRNQAPDFGASERFAVSPGREHSGYFHMPCGQSGHPLSDNYGDGHADWVEGKARPFLPGETVGTLLLVP